MVRKLYWAPGSAFSFRVMIALKEKNLDFESHKLNITKGNNKSKLIKYHPN